MSLRGAAAQFGAPTFTFYSVDRGFEFVEFEKDFEKRILIESAV